MIETYAGAALGAIVLGASAIHFAATSGVDWRAVGDAALGIATLIGLIMLVLFSAIQTTELLFQDLPETEYGAKAGAETLFFCVIAIIYMLAYGYATRMLIEWYDGDAIRLSKNA